MNLLQKNLRCAITACCNKPVYTGGLIAKNLRCAITTYCTTPFCAINLSMQEALLHNTHYMRTPPHDQVTNYLDNLFFSSETDIVLYIYATNIIFYILYIYVTWCKLVSDDIQIVDTE